MTRNNMHKSAMTGLEQALPSLRPELHRYCARMSGSAVDGEDILQEALVRAAEALRKGAKVTNLRAWLFRIAHNTALNYLRSRKSEAAMKDNVSLDMPAFDQMPQRSALGDSLRPFLQLTPKQRSTVILRDVLGYSASEVAELTDSTVQSVKSALHRGRSLLQQYDPEDDIGFAALSQEQRRKLALYADRFNAHDFEALRDMLSSEVRLDLVDKDRREGREAVGGYFANYSVRDDWVMAPGQVAGRPALLAFDRQDPAAPPFYFVVLDFADDEVIFIRDFRYARYAMTDAEWERF